MKRTIVSVIAAVLLLASTAAAQERIKIVKRPAPNVGPDEEVVYVWNSSWGLRDDPADKYPLGIATHKTEAEAVAAAKAHIARTAQNRDLAVTHYLIEGEPSVQKKKSVEPVKQATDLLGRLKEAKAAVDHAKKVDKGEASVFKAKERKLLDTTKEYKDMVAKSYRQAVEVKKTLTGGVAALTDAKFREVNGLIDNYNREIQDYKGVMGNDADLGFTPLARVQPPAQQKPGEEIVGSWLDATLGLTMTFRADGTFSSVGKGQSLEGTWKLSGTSFSATLPDKNRFVSHMQGELRGDTITYTYHVTHPEKGRSGTSGSHTLKRQR